MYDNVQERSPYPLESSLFCMHSCQCLQKHSWCLCAQPKPTPQNERGKERMESCLSCCAKYQISLHILDPSTEPVNGGGAQRGDNGNAMTRTAKELQNTSSIFTTLEQQQRSKLFGSKSKPTIFFIFVRLKLYSKMTLTSIIFYSPLYNVSPVEHQRQNKNPYCESQWGPHTIIVQTKQSKHPSRHNSFVL